MLLLFMRKPNYHMAKVDMTPHEWNLAPVFPSLRDGIWMEHNYEIARVDHKEDIS